MLAYDIFVHFFLFFFKKEMHMYIYIYVCGSLYLSYEQNAGQFYCARKFYEKELSIYFQHVKRVLSCKQENVQLQYISLQSICMPMKYINFDR